jgi:hypothetical protein
MEPSTITQQETELAEKKRQEIEARLKQKCKSQKLQTD